MEHDLPDGNRSRYLNMSGKAHENKLHTLAVNTAFTGGTTQEVAKFFTNQVVLRHGAPAVAVTHRGTPYNAVLMPRILRYSNTDHRRTALTTPNETNGTSKQGDSGWAVYVCRS